MMLLLVLIAIAVIAGSVYADYKWRRWMEVRRQQRDHPGPATKP